MSSAVLLVLGALAAGLAIFVATRAWWQFSGQRVITCPENQKPAAVRVDAAHAALTAIGGPNLRLSVCSRWPDKKDCGQECLKQISAAPEDCLVRTILSHWYEGKSCVWCGKPIGPVHVAGNQPALMDSDGKTLEWPQVPAETIPAILATHRPVCWTCHTTNTFVKQHPALVIDRSARA